MGNTVFRQDKSTENNDDVGDDDEENTTVLAAHRVLPCSHTVSSQGAPIFFHTQSLTVVSQKEAAEMEICTLQVSHKGEHKHG